MKFVICSVLWLFFVVSIAIRDRVYILVSLNISINIIFYFAQLCIFQMSILIIGISIYRMISSNSALLLGSAKCPVWVVVLPMLKIILITRKFHNWSLLLNEFCFFSLFRNWVFFVIFSCFSQFSVYQWVKSWKMRSFVVCLIQSWYVSKLSPFLVKESVIGRF